jgi:DNA replication protein DnaC
MTTETHLATALGIAATEAGYRTYFVSAADLVANLQSAHLEGTAAYKMRTYTTPPPDITTIALLTGRF